MLRRRVFIALEFDQKTGGEINKLFIFGNLNYLQNFEYLIFDVIFAMLGSC